MYILCNYLFIAHIFFINNKIKISRTGAGALHISVQNCNSEEVIGTWYVWRGGISWCQVWAQLQRGQVCEMMSEGRESVGEVTLSHTVLLSWYQYCGAVRCESVWCEASSSPSSTSPVIWRPASVHQHQAWSNQSLINNHWPIRAQWLDNQPIRG